MQLSRLDSPKQMQLSRLDSPKPRSLFTNKKTVQTNAINELDEMISALEQDNPQCDLFQSILKNIGSRQNNLQLTNIRVCFQGGICTIKKPITDSAAFLIVYAYIKIFNEKPNAKIMCQYLKDVGYAIGDENDVVNIINKEMANFVKIDDYLCIKTTTPFSFSNTHTIIHPIGNSDFQIKNYKKYTSANITYSVNDLKNCKSSSLSYTIFKDVFVKRTGEFNKENPETTSVMNALTDLVKNYNFTNRDCYKIFRHIFVDVNLKSIFADQNNPITISMIDAFTYLIKNHMECDADNVMMTAFINSVQNGRFCEYSAYRIIRDVILEPIGIFANSDEHTTKAMVDAVMSLVKRVNLKTKHKKDVFDYYIKHSDVNSIFFKTLESLTLHFLVDDKLQYPQVLQKIATRVADGFINIADTKQGIYFFGKLYSNSGIILSTILRQNLAYFINRDGEDVIQSILRNNFLISPPEHNAI